MKDSEQDINQIQSHWKIQIIVIAVVFGKISNMQDIGNHDGNKTGNMNLVEEIVELSSDEQCENQDQNENKTIDTCFVSM